MPLDRPADRSKTEYRIKGRQYTLLSDLHTHTVYSHGTGTVRDNVLAARERGVLRVGIADHGPAHLGFGVPRKKFARQKAEVLALREEFPDMEILQSVEANILADGRLDVRPEERGFFDYVCAGWHYGTVGGMTPKGIASTFENLARSTAAKATKPQLKRNTEAVVRAIEGGGICFLTHPGDKAPVDLLEVAAACARTGTLVELNTHHMSLTAADVRTMAIADVRFLISSDAHSPARVGDFTEAVYLLLDAGIDLSRVVNLKVE
ncbi:MAG: PHP domain-containing protein [Clostridiales Family XIII bacterium]|jgi:putative hydrolase|nr:PHP domain-containing protein [Clostridiales Family XIII bacterium]